MVVLDDDDGVSKSEDDLQAVNHTNFQILELEEIAKRTQFRRYVGTPLWVLVFLGILLCFPVGFIGLYFMFVARVDFFDENTERAMRRAYIAKMTSLTAVIVGAIWVGLLVGLTVWS